MYVDTFFSYFSILIRSSCFSLFRWFNLNLPVIITNHPSISLLCWMQIDPNYHAMMKSHPSKPPLDPVDTHSFFHLSPAPVSPLRLRLFLRFRFCLSYFLIGFGVSLFGMCGVFLVFFSSLNFGGIGINFWRGHDRLTYFIFLSCANSDALSSLLWYSSFFKLRSARPFKSTPH